MQALEEKRRREGDRGRVLRCRGGGDAGAPRDDMAVEEREFEYRTCMCAYVAYGT